MQLLNHSLVVTLGLWQRRLAASSVPPEVSYPADGEMSIADGKTARVPQGLLIHLKLASYHW